MSDKSTRRFLLAWFLIAVLIPLIPVTHTILGAYRVQKTHPEVMLTPVWPLLVWADPVTFAVLYSIVGAIAALSLYLFLAGLLKMIRAAEKRSFSVFMLISTVASGLVMLFAAVVLLTRRLEILFFPFRGL